MSGTTSRFWPLQLFLCASGLLAVCLALQRKADFSKSVAIILAMFWIWMGLAYHLWSFSTINRAALIFGAFFLCKPSSIPGTAVERSSKISLIDMNGLAAVVRVDFDRSSDYRSLLKIGGGMENRQQDAFHKYQEPLTRYLQPRKKLSAISAAGAQLHSVSRALSR